MANAFVGKWKCTTVENFDDFLKELGVNLIARKVGAGLKPTVQIEYNSSDDKWKITSEASVKTTSVAFELDKEFEEESPDGRLVRSVTTFDGKKMVHTQRENGKILCMVTREINSNGEQIVTFKAGDVTARRIFQRA